MLEVRYDKVSGKLSGWSSRRGNLKKHLKKGKFRGRNVNEAIALLDIDAPTGSIDSVLYRKGDTTLIPNPSYVEPKEIEPLTSDELNKVKKLIKR
ncbi:MAG: hypothetical protein CMI54_02925 [Parcubacteria group bacterium]|nr:hypothetical protein [Parcubacteria group bacterium]|tara:strand:- start:16708 stop:16992 length:285 start_codon:yes stop_codon:yes gene_type:complete